MNGGSWPVDRRAELARREVERRLQVERVDLDPNPRGDDAPGGWAVLPSWIACDPSLSPEARVVLLVLSSHADDRTHPFPSIARLARLVGRSDRTILRVIAELERRGLVQRQHRFRNGEQVSSAYVMRFDRWGRDGKARGGVSPVTERGDTDDAPQGDTDDTLRGDTGVVQTKTKDQDQGKRIQTPHSPPQGGTRGERIRQVARELGIRTRDARRLVESEEARSAFGEEVPLTLYTDDELEALRAEATGLYGTDGGDS